MHETASYTCGVMQTGGWGPAGFVLVTSVPIRVSAAAMRLSHPIRRPVIDTRQTHKLLATAAFAMGAAPAKTSVVQVDGS